MCKRIGSSFSKEFQQKTWQAGWTSSQAHGWGGNRHKADSCSAFLGHGACFNDFLNKRELWPAFLSCMET